MIGRNPASMRIAPALVAVFCLWPQSSAAQVYGPWRKNLGDGAQATASVHIEDGDPRLYLSGSRNGSCPLEEDLWVDGNEVVRFRQMCDVGGVLDEVIVEGTVEIYGYERNGSNISFSVHLRGEAWDDTMFGRGATLGSISDGWTGIRVAIPPTANFDRVWADHNIERNGQKGLVLYAHMQVRGMLGREIEVVAFFEHEGTGRHIQSIHGGNAIAWDRVTPSYESSNWDDFELFFPYSDFSLPSGRTSIEFYYVVRVSGGASIGRSERASFTLTR